MLADNRPRSIRLESCSACNLRCPSCPTTTGAIHPAVGTGMLTLDDFRRLLDDGPWVEHIELSNYGEAFLNPELEPILELAAQRGVAVSLQNGVNLNRCSDAALEAVVKHGVRSMTCSIDGASQETYEQYRVRGKFERVIDNIRKINAYKAKHGTARPHLRWQFVVMGHNEHEISAARRMARELGMEFDAKLTWDEEFSPIRDTEAVRKELGIPTSRSEFSEEAGVGYMDDICLQLWQEPQVNWDGKLLGCCRNFWGDFGPNVFERGLEGSLADAKMRAARDMLQGKEGAARDDIPCTTCDIYLERKANQRWISKRRLALERLRAQAGNSRAWARVRGTGVGAALRTAVRSVLP